MNEERNIRNSDLNLKTLLIYKTVAKWYFFTLFIYANHIFNRLNSLQYGLYSLILHHIVATSNLKCKTKEAHKQLQTIAWWFERRRSGWTVYFAHSTTDTWLPIMETVDSGRRKIQQQKHWRTSVILSKLPLMSENTTSPAELLQITHTVVHIWCNSVWQFYAQICTTVYLCGKGYFIDSLDVCHNERRQ